MRRCYIAGPMSNLKDHNYPAFHAAAARLRAKGLHVENPAEVKADPPPTTWDGWMRLAIAQLITCDTIAMLPGWSLSRGAKIERQLAMDLDMDVIYLED